MKIIEYRMWWIGLLLNGFHRVVVVIWDRIPQQKGQRPRYQTSYEKESVEYYFHQPNQYVSLLKDLHMSYLIRKISKFLKGHMFGGTVFAY